STLPVQNATSRKPARISSKKALPRIVTFFFFNDTATPDISTLSLHDALPIYLIEADVQPGIGAADQEAVDAGSVEEGDHGGVLDPADTAALEVYHRHGHQFR